MNAGLLVLPFLSLFIAALGVVVNSSLKEVAWLAPAIWLVAGVVAMAWVILDRKHLRAMFLRKGARYGASSGLTVVLGILVALGVGTLSTRARFNKSVDFTKNNINTLSEQTLRVIAANNDKGTEAEIIGFFQDEVQEQMFRDLLRLYEAAGAKFNKSFLNPQTEPTKAMAEGITQGNTAVVRQGSNQVKITTFTEEKLTNALIQASKARSKKVYFTKGHGEAEISSEDADGIKGAVDELASHKVEAGSIMLLESGKVPDDADLVVVSGPKYEFKDEEIKLLEEYLQKGKPLLVMVDAMVPAAALNRLLENYGLKFGEDLLIMRPDDPRAQLLGQNNAIVSDFDAFHVVTKDFARQSAVALIMGSTRSLEIVTTNTAQAKPSIIGKTADVIFGVGQVRSMADLKEIGEDRVKQGPFGVIGVSQAKVGGALAKNEKAESPATTADLKPDSSSDAVTKDLRVAVVGSSQFVTNAGSQHGENIDLFMNLVNFLTQDEDYIAIRPKDPDRTTIDLTSASSQLLLALIAFIYPTSFLGLGVYNWLRRRRA